MESWYLVVCKAGQEERAKINLNNQGIEAFYPVLITPRFAKGRRILRQRALFPSYLFICLNLESANFSAVKNTRGIKGFVTYGASYQIVPLKIVQQLMCEFTKLDAKEALKTGDIVSLCNSSFNNIDAIYKEPDGDKRSMLFINLLNKQVEISVCNKDFTKHS